MVKGPNDWPEGMYYSKCVLCKVQYIGPKRSYNCYKCETLEETIDYAKIRNGKAEMMRRFKLSYDKAKAEGTITYKKI